MRRVEDCLHCDLLIQALPNLLYKEVLMRDSRQYRSVPESRNPADLYEIY